MRATLAQLAALVEGELLGGGDLVIEGAAPLGDAQPGQITLVDGGERSQNLSACRATAVIAPRGFSPAGLPAILVHDAHRAFALVVAFFHPRPQRPESA